MNIKKNPPINSIGFLSLLLTLTYAPWAQATTNIALPFYESFAYPGNGIKLGNDALNGSDTWGNTRNMPNLTNTGSLTYPGLLASVGNKITVIGGAANCDDNGPRPNFASGVSSGSLYFSFLIRVKSTLGVAGNPDPGRCIVNLTAGGGTSRVLGVALADDGAGNTQIGVVKWPKTILAGTQSGSSFFAPPISTDGSTTYFVVAKYEIKTAGSTDDECTLWLNPSSAYFGGLTEDPGHKVVVNTGTDGGGISISRFYVQQGFDAEIDELRIGKNWIDVAPSACDAPNILTAPVAVTNGIGGRATFTATASGTFVNYRWRRNGTNLVDGGNISGATNATLVVDPITAADGVPQPNGYALVVSNSCFGGSAQTSAPVALTLISGASLTWTGDGGANEWDVSITTNWNNNTLLFSNFDNVTFDDSSINFNVSVVGSPQPLQVLGNTTNDYTLTGTISDPAFVIKTNTGRLILNGPNNYTGKTTIKQGRVAIGNENGLGSNPVIFQPKQLTLDGGILETMTTLTIDDLNRGIFLTSSGGQIEVDGSSTLTMKSPIGGNVGGNLVKIGDGTLKMQSFNTYAGNTTVSNGTMYLDNTSGIPFGNGVGTFILAGGSLTVESRGDSALDILNPVNVAADSAITTVQTSKPTVDFRIHNNVSCLSGTAQLTIRNDSGIGNFFHVRLYGSNLTYNGTVVNDPSSGGGAQWLSSNNQGGTHNFNGEISGAGSFTRRADSAPGGDTIMNAANTYTGGTILSRGGIGFGTSSVGSPNSPTSGPIGTGALTQDTSGGGSITKVFASGGARNVGNSITLALTSKPNFVIGGTNDLTLSGDIDLTFGATIQVDNTANSILSGTVSDGGLTKTGNGILLLNGQVGADFVMVNAGTLGGTGTLSGPLTVNAGATLSPGASIGTLTVNSDVTLAGNTLMEVNKTAGTHDLVTGVNNLTYGGTLTATNLSGTMTTNSTFTIFSATTPVGDFSSILGSPGPGMLWKFNPATGVLSVVGTASNRTNISYSLSGANLTLTWPATHLGWIAASNSVNVADPSQWFDIPGSGSVTTLNLTVDPAKKSVFYRLHSP